MTTNELKILEIIWNWGGETSVDNIAREAGISIDYSRLICESLRGQDCIDFLHSKLGKIKSKGKLAVARKLGRESKKTYLERSRRIVIPEKPSRLGLGKDKRGRLILNYG